MFNSVIDKIKFLYSRLPNWLQKAITDFVSAAVVTVAGLGLAFPKSFEDAKAEAIVVGVALGHVAWNAGRRALPAAWAWIVGLFK